MNISARAGGGEAPCACLVRELPRGIWNTGARERERGRRGAFKPSHPVVPPRPSVSSSLRCPSGGRNRSSRGPGSRCQEAGDTTRSSSALLAGPGEGSATFRPTPLDASPLSPPPSAATWTEEEKADPRQPPFTDSRHHSTPSDIRLLWFYPNLIETVTLKQRPGVAV
ncbi:hypothetical protein GN956_G18947 [Arapaima gigas]